MAAYAPSSPQSRPLGMAQAFSAGVPAELTTFVRKTYGLLAFSLFLAAGACGLMMKALAWETIPLASGAAVTLPVVPPALRWGLILGSLGFLAMSWFVKNGARSGEASVLGLLALTGFVSCVGAGLAPLIGTYVGFGMAKTVALAAGVTAVTFTGLTAFVLVSGKDFSFLRNFLFVAILGLVVAGIAGWWIHDAQFHWWRAAIGSVVFCGFILFDTSNVVRVYGPGNLVVPAVIALFLDIVNLFLLLLQLFTRRRD